MENVAHKMPLHKKHEALQAQIVDFCGWQMPMQYQGIVKEHNSCREDVAIFDTSHMGELFFKGDISDINSATSIDIASLTVGKCKYGFLLNEKGGVIDDLIAYKLSESEIMFVVNASRTAIDYDTLKKRISQGTLEDCSKEYAKLDIQGPRSIEMLKPYFKDDLNAIKRFSFIQTTLFNEKCIVSKTGYTGEDGFELYLAPSAAHKIWEELIKKGVTPAGLGARDALRLEMGYSLYANELTETITPIEASLGIFINFKHDFIGKEALQQQKDNGVKRKIIAFKTQSRRSARKGFLLHQNDKRVGIVTSGAFSPILKCGIGLAMVEVNLFDTTQSFDIKDARSIIKADTTKLPFIKK